MYCHNIVNKIIERAKLHDYISEKDVCPKCGKGLVIDEYKRMYNCSNCKNVGNIATFLMVKEKKNFKQIIEELAEKECVELQECIYETDEYDLEKCKKCKLFKQ